MQDSLEIIEEEADRLTGMIENLLDASRLQAGGLKIKRSDMCIPDFCNRLAARFQTQTNQHRILVDFPDDFPIILADETRIEQVISNLISNAIKYAPRWGYCPSGGRSCQTTSNYVSVIRVPV